MNLGNDDLYQKHDQLINLKKETYEKLYQRCANIIKLTSKAGELICLFEIPSFLFGSSYPIINIKSCANYIINKLTESNNNIRVTFVEPNILLIDWRRPEDIQDNIIPNKKVHTKKSRSKKTRHTSKNK
ncbi:hypothetical protein [Powai lake megavirus]|uniref:Uncharacterized protein n=1 Tax=Powai lake megavirus TaxID=1842663 RepID=A0A167RDB9_9VIRU|nr:hypothetical protein QJ849_gp393 [Powai lake megavirus]ANB50555.1 hypothetical protein [Powai lake megavirus]WBF70826.1 hypothetical protein [Megavirus caiporensis]